MPTSNNLISKIKEGIAAYLASLALPALNGYHFVRGLRTGLQKLPTIIVACGGAEPVDQDTASPEKFAMVTIFVETRAEQDVAGTLATSEDAHDEAVAAVLDATRPLYRGETRAHHADALRAFVNSENTGSRPVTDFHLGHFLEPKWRTGYNAEPGRPTYLTAIAWEKMPVMDSDGDS